MTDLDSYCDALVTEVADYRDGEIRVDRAHARRWVDQFEPAERDFVASLCANVG